MIKWFLLSPSFPSVPGTLPRSRSRSRRSWCLKRSLLSEHKKGGSKKGRNNRVPVGKTIHSLTRAEREARKGSMRERGSPPRLLSICLFFVLFPDRLGYSSLSHSSLHRPNLDFREARGRNKVSRESSQPRVFVALLAGKERRRRAFFLHSVDGKGSLAFWG